MSCRTNEPYFHISGLLQPELYTTFLASIIFFHSVAKAQHREQGKHLSTIIGGIYLLSLQLDSIYTTQRDNSFINTSSQSPRTRLDTYCINI